MKRMRVEAFAQLTGKLAHPRIYSGDKNRNTRILVRLRTEKRRHQRQLEKLALKIEPGAVFPAIPNGSDRQNDFADFFHWLFPFDAETPLIVPFHLCAETENKPASGVPREIPGDLRENSRTAWKCHRNARPETQARAMLGSQHERQEWFVCGFEGPDAIESRVVGKPCQRRHLFQLVYEQARVKLHRLLYSLLD